MSNMLLSQRSLGCVIKLQREEHLVIINISLYKAYNHIYAADVESAKRVPKLASKWTILLPGTHQLSEIQNL